MNRNLLYRKINKKREMNLSISHFLKDRNRQYKTRMGIKYKFTCWRLTRNGCTSSSFCSSHEAKKNVSTEYNKKMVQRGQNMLLVGACRSNCLELRVFWLSFSNIASYYCSNVFSIINTFSNMYRCNLRWMIGYRTAD